MNTESDRATVVALGNFDGLHIGHRKLIRHAVDIARREGLTSCVWSFEIHPSFYLNQQSPGLLLSPEQKKRMLAEWGVDHFFSADFARIRDLSCEDFVDQILVDSLRAAHVVCGFNYSFGKGASGTVELLEKLLSRRGIRITVEAPVQLDGVTVSSTLIRNLMEQGKMEQANRLLSVPFALESTVERGNQLGRTKGVPTVNQPIPPEYVDLRKGVYAARVTTEGKSYHAVTNVGVRPTVSRRTERNCESHLLDFEGDLYGKTVKTELLRFIRDEKEFESVEALFRQIKIDAKEVREYFENAK